MITEIKSFACEHDRREYYRAESALNDNPDKLFEEWFKKNGHDEDYKEAFRLGWDGCLEVLT